MLKDHKLPDCMLPDGAPPCDTYQRLFETAQRYEQALLDIMRHQKVVGGGYYQNTGAWNIASIAINKK